MKIYCLHSIVIATPTARYVYLSAWQANKNAKSEIKIFIAFREYFYANKFALNK